MKNEIPSFLQKYIVERPATLGLRAGRHGEKTQNIIDLIAMVDNLHPNKAAQFDINEAKNLFGKSCRENISRLSKRANVKVRISANKETVYVWRVQV